MFTRKIGFSLLITLCLFLFASPSFAVDKAQTFRILTEEFPPYNYSADDGNIQGISTEIVREILKRTDHADTIEILPWADGYRIAQDEENIILFSTTRSAAREGLFKWVGPLVPNNLVFFARKGAGLEIKTLEDAKAIKSVGVYRDDFGELFLKEKGFQNLDAVLENSQNIPKLINGEIDLWIANELTGKHMIAKAGVGNRIKKIYEVKKSYMYLAFSKNTSDAVIKQWQTTLDAIKSDGTYAQIFSQWIMFSYTEDLKPDTPEKRGLTLEEKAWIEAHPIIRIAPDPDYAPFQFVGTNGKSQGMANDYLKLIGQKLGLSFELMETKSWGDSLDLVKKRQADMVVVATQTPDRLKYLAFTRAYVTFPEYIVTRKGQDFIPSLESLKGKTVATMKGFAINSFVREKYPQINLLMKPNVEAVLQSVSTGDSDATLMNMATTSYAIGRMKIVNLRVDGETDFVYNLAFASRNDWPQLNILLNKALTWVTEDERKEILNKWISISPREQPRKSELEFTAEERQWLDGHPVILAASDPSWPPIEFLNEDGKFFGMVADYIALVEKKLGIKIKVVPQGNWSEALKSAKDRKVSVLTAAVRTPERDKYMLFTKPYIELPAVIIVNNKTEGISSMADLRGKKVVVVKDYGTHNFLKKGFPYLDLSVVPNIKAGLYEISYGKADAFVANLASASYFIEKNAIQNLRVAGESGYVYELGIASRTDWLDLHYLLEKGLDSITEEERQTIYRKWIGLKHKSWEPNKEQIIVFGAICGLILVGIVLCWNLALKRTVTIRTTALEEALARFRATLESTTDGILVVNKKGEIDSFNKKFPKIWRMPDTILQSRKSKGLTDYAMSQLKDPDVFLSKIEEIYASPEAVSHDLLEFKDGRLVSCASRPQQIGIENVGRVWSFRDITARKKAEKETKKAKEDAELASKAKGEFLATMSHEIRSPLNAVIGLTDLACSTGSPDKRKEYLQMARGSANNLLILVNDILDLTKIERGKMEVERVSFDLMALINETLVPQRFLATQKGLTFDLHVATNVPQAILGAPSLMRQIITNIVGNAVKFTQKGRIDFEVDLADDSTLVTEGGMLPLRFVTKDTGIGIPEAQQKKIFESFTQGDSSTTRKFGGTGLGTTISKQLLELMDGTIQLESKPGQGSKFTFIIPVSKTDESTLQKAPVSSIFDGIPTKYESLKILLAEDNMINSYMAVESLTLLGQDVTTARDGKQCLAMLEGGDFDLVLMDVMMPEMDGFEATRRIRKKEVVEGGHIPIIALTAGALKEDRASCLEAGMDEYLTKPINFDLLMEKVCTLTGITAVGTPETFTADEVDLETTPLYDLSLLREKIGDDPGKLQDLLSWFVRDSTEQIKAAEQELTAGQTQQVVKSCHKIRGSAESLGATGLKKCAEDAEKVGKSGDLDGCRKKMVMVKEVFDLVVTEMKKANDLTS